MSNSQANGPEAAGGPSASVDATAHRELLEIQARFCRTMGHPVRLHILHCLFESGGELSSARLRELAGVGRTTLSQHLGKMASVGLVHTVRRGRYVHVKLASDEIGRACQLVHSALSRQTQSPAPGRGD